MGLKGGYTDPYGAAHPNAYAMIWQYQVIKDRKKGHVGVSIYHDEVARRAGKEPLVQLQILVENRAQSTAPDNSVLLATSDFDNYMADSKLIASGSTPTKQGYAYIKTLPDFQGWVNVQ